MEVDVQTCASTATILAVLITAFGVLARKIDRVEVRVDQLRVHMDEGFGRVETRPTTLEQRTYDLPRSTPTATPPAD